MKVLVVTAMYPTPENPAFGSFIRTQVESLKAVGLEVELLVLRRRLRKLMYPYGVWQLRNRLRKAPVDLVHAHYGYVGMVARTQRRVPVVVTYHGDDLLATVNERGEHTRFSRLAVQGGRVLGRSVDAAIVQSSEMAGKLEGANVYIVPHEVDLELFRPLDKSAARRELGLDPHRKYLLFAANPAIAVKRFALAKEVADRLQEQDEATELLVVYKETQERLALYMNACDVLLFTSYQEGSPNIVKQAMACNLPLVSTRVGDVEEIVGGTNGCYLVEPKVDEFVARLVEVLKRRERTDGREAVRHLESAVVARNVMRVYEQTLERASARSSSGPHGLSRGG